jgi:polar amino acid transport system substrate-binding protein
MRAAPRSSGAHRHHRGAWSVVPAAVRVVLVVSVLFLVAAGCGGDDEGASTSTTEARETRRAAANSVGAPEKISIAGRIRFCSDISYPPAEFYNGSTPAGFDIDIASEAARLMGVEASFRNTAFDAILDELASGKCDAIISSLSDTPERRDQVDFADYMTIGQSLMMREGDAASVETLEDLGGQRVGVQRGTINLTYLSDERDRLVADGEEAYEIVEFAKGTEAVNALKTGDVDAYLGDTPVVAYYIGQDSASFAFAGKPIGTGPIGIATRKSDTELHAAFEQALRVMYRDGTMQEILEKWELGDFALPKN